MPGISNLLPFRALRGLFGGMEDGFRGKMDENEHFKDGKWANDPTKKSKAGRFLSEWSGVRGSHEKGQKIGKWGGAFAAGGLMAHFLVTTAMVGVGFAAWPIFSGMLLVGATAWLAGNIGAVLGRNIGMISGGLFGAIGGAVVGAYNGIFKRGAFHEPKAPGEETVPDAPKEPKKSKEASPETPEQATGKDGKTDKSQPVQAADPAVAPQAKAVQAPEKQKSNGIGVGKTLLAGAGILGFAAAWKKYNTPAAASPATNQTKPTPDPKTAAPAPAPLTDQVRGQVDSALAAGGVNKRFISPATKVDSLDDALSGTEPTRDFVSREKEREAAPSPARSGKS